MLPELTYEQYGSLGGAQAEGAFKASLRAAEAAVREVMGFNEPASETQQKAYLRAVTAAIEVDAAYGCSGGIGEGLQSITVGSFSASVGSTEASDPYTADMRRAVRRELAGTGLLYQGIG